MCRAHCVSHWWLISDRHDVKEESGWEKRWKKWWEIDGSFHGEVCAWRSVKSRNLMLVIMANYSHVRRPTKAINHQWLVIMTLLSFALERKKRGQGNKMPLSVLMKLSCLRYVNTHTNTCCTSWSEWKAVKSEVTPWGISGKIQVNCSYHWMQFNQWVSAYIYNYHHFPSFFFHRTDQLNIFELKYNVFPWADMYI